MIFALPILAVGGVGLLHYYFITSIIKNQYAKYGYQKNGVTRGHAVLNG